MANPIHVSVESKAPRSYIVVKNKQGKHFPYHIPSSARRHFVFFLNDKTAERIGAEFYELILIHTTSQRVSFPPLSLSVFVKNFHGDIVLLKHVNRYFQREMQFLPQRQVCAVCERRERETEINYLRAGERRLRPSIYLPGFLDMSEKSELCGPETEEMLPIRPLKHKSHSAALSYQAANIQFPLR